MLETLIAFAALVRPPSETADPQPANPASAGNGISGLRESHGQRQALLQLAPFSVIRSLGGSFFWLPIDNPSTPYKEAGQARNAAFRAL
jgi:hypothetical protein